MSFWTVRKSEYSTLRGRPSPRIQRGPKWLGAKIFGFGLHSSKNRNWLGAWAPTQPNMVPLLLLSASKWIDLAILWFIKKLLPGYQWTVFIFVACWGFSCWWWLSISIFKESLGKSNMLIALRTLIYHLSSYSGDDQKVQRSYMPNEQLLF